MSMGEFVCTRAYNLRPGLVSFLADKFVPGCLVLFGSASRGEDVEDSDMDLLVISRENKVELEEFEHRVRRRISLHFEEKTSNIPKELLNVLLR